MSPAATSLPANAVWALAGNLGYTACQWGVLVAIAKLATAADVGRFALALAVAAPTVMLANLHLRAVQATDATGAYPFGAYLGLRLVTTTLAAVAITGVALACGYDAGTTCLMLAVAAAKAVEAVSDVTFGLMQQAEDLRRIALSMLAKGVLGAGALAAALAVTGNLVLAVAAMTAVWAVVLVALDLRAAARLAHLRPILDARRLAPLAWLALPLGCVMALGSLTTNVPRYALEASLGPAALGHFAAIAYLVVAASQPMMALGAAASPRLARHFETDRAAYVRLSRRAMLVAAAFGVAAVAAAALGGRPFLTLAYAPEYAEHAGLLVWMALGAAAGFVASALGYSITAARRFPQQLAIAVLGLIVCAVASHWLVPRHGLVGAAWALLAAQGARLACLGLVYAATCAAAPHPVTRIASDGLPSAV